MDRIVVGVDSSDASAAALRWAADEARRRTATLVVVYAYLAPWAYSGTEDVIQRIDPELHDDMRRRLEAFVSAAQGDLADLEVVLQLHPGRAADGLLSAAGAAELLVVGSRGAGGFEGLLLGSTAEHCARHAPCPVVVVPRSSSRAPTGRVVAGIDGSESARAALRWAIDAAHLRHAAVEAVCVYEPYDARGPFGGRFMQLASPGSAERFRHRAEHDVERAVDTCRGGGTTVEVKAVVAAGHPAQVLIEHAADADLLVTGRRGQHGFPGLMLGSVSRQVLHHAACPVAIVPA